MNCYNLALISQQRKQARHCTRFYNDVLTWQHLPTRPTCPQLGRVANPGLKKIPGPTVFRSATFNNKCKFNQCNTKQVHCLMAVWKLHSVLLKQKLPVILQWCNVRTSQEKPSFLPWSCFLWVRWNCCLCLADCSWQIPVFWSSWLKHRTKYSDTVCSITKATGILKHSF